LTTYRSDPVASKNTQIFALETLVIFKPLPPLPGQSSAAKDPSVFRISAAWADPIPPVGDLARVVRYAYVSLDADAARVRTAKQKVENMIFSILCLIFLFNARCLAVLPVSHSAITLSRWFFVSSKVIKLL
ncbi:MAG: hypothetical protein ACPLQO_04275, partial [Desulfotomaculales bacterium]